MADPRTLYNEYHKALMEAKIDSAKLAQQNAIKAYEIDKRAESYNLKTQADMEKVKQESRRAYYNTFVEAMGKMSEFDSKNPLNVISQQPDGTYKMENPETGQMEDISAGQYLIYAQENKNIMQVRKLVMEGYLSTVKNIGEYDPDAVQRAMKQIRKGGAPPSGVTTNAQGVVQIVDKADGIAKNINEKTQEDLSDPKAPIEEYLEKDIVDFNKSNPTLDPSLAGKMRNANDPIPSSFVIDRTPEFLAKHSQGAVGTTTARNPMTEEEAQNFIDKGGMTAGGNVSNSAGINTQAYSKALEKKLNK